MDLNLKLRSEILECSLNLEKEINNLIMLFLGINHDNKIKVFGSTAASISFRNKIDLLTDLKILSSDENFDFNFLMEFRNKFLHVADCNTFEDAFRLLGNSQKNKLQNFIEDGGNIDSEKDCLAAFKNLYLKNLKVLLAKIETKEKTSALKIEIIDNLKKQSLLQVDFFFDLIKEINRKFASINEYNDKEQEIVKDISEICSKHSKRYSSDDKFLSLQKREQELIADSEFMKEFMNITDLNRKISDKNKKND